MADILVFQKQGENTDKFETAGKTGQAEHVMRIVTEEKGAEEAVQTKTYRFILIDLEGMEESGIAFAFFVRGLKEYRMTPILFFAKDKKYEQMAFHDIHCYDYMVKPICTEEMLRIVYLYLTHSPNLVEDSQIRFRVYGEDYMISVQDIIYMEALNRSVFVHTVNYILEVPYMKLRDCVSYGEGAFLQCHRSYIVNRRYIRKIDYVNHQIELKDAKEKIFMGRKYERLLRHKFDD